VTPGNITKRPLGNRSATLRKSPSTSSRKRAAASTRVGVCTLANKGRRSPPGARRWNSLTTWAVVAAIWGIPPDVRWRGQLWVQAARDCTFHPGGNPLTLDHLGAFRMVCIEGHRGGADGQGQQTVLVQCRKAHGDGAPDRLANEVDSGQLQLVQEL